MIEINKVIVPSSTGDGNGKLSYKDGKVVTYEHGSVVNVYLFHEQDGEQQRAFELTVDAPLTYDKCVNAAEMEAYGLADAMALVGPLTRPELPAAKPEPKLLKKDKK